MADIIRRVSHELRAASCHCDCDCDNRYLSATASGLRVCAACKRKHATLAEIANTCSTHAAGPTGQWAKQWRSNGIPTRSAAEWVFNKL